MIWRIAGRRAALWLSLTLFTAIPLIFFTYQNPVPLRNTAQTLYLVSPPPPPDLSYFPPTPDLCIKETKLSNDDLCASFPTHLLDKIQLTVKTGIGERHRLEALLASYGSCIPNLIIVSDVEDDLNDGRHVHDILADLPSTYANNNSDWCVYEEQRAALAQGEQTHKSREGWKLDSYKFLPMVEYARARNLAADWYVFFEADTYMFWDVLFRVLEKLDPSKRHYLGTAVAGSYDRWFAYGGSGFVLSRGLLSDLPLTGEKSLSAKYEEMAKPECCGDALLAYVLHKELGVRIGTMAPTFFGDQPQWVWVSAKNLCTPLLSLHHVSADMMGKLWRWERCRRSMRPEQPITFATLLDWTLTPVVHEIEVRSHWDNGANKERKKGSSGHVSAEACFELCKLDKKCLQAMYSEGTCRFADKVRAGVAVDEQSESFWDLWKLAKMGWQPGVDSSAMCSTIHWVTPKIMRPGK